jgi:hypothetical protein
MGTIPMDLESLWLQAFDAIILHVLAVPFEGILRGVGVLEHLARVADAVGGRALGADIDFVGDAGVVLANLRGAVYGRDMEGADTQVNWLCGS